MEEEKKDRVNAASETEKVPETERTIVISKSGTLPKKESFVRCRETPEQRSRQTLMERLNITSVFGRKRPLDNLLGKPGVDRYSHENVKSHAVSKESLPEVTSDYEIKEVFAEGGQGILQVAEDKHLGRIVALKTLKRSNEPRDVEREFLEEAQVTAQLDHPSIIPVYGLATDRNQGLHLSMKLVNGHSLREYLKNVKLNYRIRGVASFDEHAALFQRLEIFLHICDAMAYAHHKNIMHCDLKPENVMLGEYNDVYLMDWGLARKIRDDAGKSSPLEVIAGTPRYISPEALEDKPCDQRADIFSLGLILQEVVTLDYGVPGSTMEELVDNIRSGRLNAVLHFYHYPISEDLKAIVRKATAHNADDRYHTVDALAADIRSYMQDGEVSARPDGKVRKFLRWLYRRRSLMLFILVSAVAITALCASFAIRDRLRQEQLSSLRTEVSNLAFAEAYAVAAGVDRVSQNLEKNLSVLAERAGFLMSHDKFSHQELFLFPTGKRPVPDKLYHSAAYNDDISFSYGFAQAAPGMSGSLAVRQAKSLSPLLPFLERSLLESDPDYHLSVNSKDVLLRVAVSSGMPAKSFYVGTKEGLYLTYPWRNIRSPGMDPRKRPWYGNGMASALPYWGKPYIGVDVRAGLSLPCSMKITGPKGEFYGVIGMDISFNRIAKEVLNVKDRPAVIESALIGLDGRVLISSRSSWMNRTVSEKEALENSEVKMRFFASKYVLSKILAQDYGTMLQWENNREVLYIFIRLEQLNWVFVTKIDFQQMIQRVEKSRKLDDYRKRVMMLHSSRP